MRLNSEEKLLSWGHNTSKNSKTPTYVTNHLGESHSKGLAASSKEIYLISNVLVRLPLLSLIWARKRHLIFGNSSWK